MRSLVEQHEAGEIGPALVKMPALPPETPVLARRIFEDMARRWGLRLGQLDDRPLPYATTEAVRAGFCRHPTQASRAIHWLEARGSIWSPGSMPRQPGKPDGTRTFLPGAKPAGALPEEACRVEAAAGVLGAVGVQQPHVEAVDQVGVGDAVAGDVRRLAAAVGGALGESTAGHGVGHGTSVRGGVGRWSP